VLAAARSGFLIGIYDGALGPERVLSSCSPS